MQLTHAAGVAIFALIAVSALILFILYRSRRTSPLRERFDEEEYDRKLEDCSARAKDETKLTKR